MDTSPQAAAVQARIHARMTPSQRIELAFEMTLAAREFAFARIRRDNQDWSEVQVVQAYLQEMSARDNFSIKFR